MMPRSSFKPVDSKRDFVERYLQGEFGNMSPSWATAESYRESGYSGLVHIRNRNAGGRTWYNVERGNFDLMWSCAAQIVNDEELYISAMAPSEKTVFQGEVVQTPMGPSLTYSLLPLPMRDALSLQKRYNIGLLARLLLRAYLCPRSHDWLQVLFDRYPFHVVEFSVYSCEWGTLKGYNTVFWECRNY